MKPKTLNDLPEMEDTETGMWIRKEEVKKELIKWYHRSGGNKHRFIREFLDMTEKELFAIYGGQE